MTDKEKIRKEVERLQKELVKEKEKGFGSDVDDACILELQNVLTYIDSLQEEPVSKDLEGAAYHNCIDRLSKESIEDFKAGAKWQKENLWKPADGDDLPEIDREVVVLYQPYPCEGNEYAVGFGHRPKEYWDGRNIETDEVTRYYPKRYDKGGWNVPDVKFWLDCNIEKLINNEEDDKR